MAGPLYIDYVGVGRGGALVNNQRENIDPADLSLEEVCARIEKLTRGMMSFWKDAHGWAPVDTAGLLSKSMLDEQASLAGSLAQWVQASSSGDLILAWVNLGVLVEGLLKLLLSVHLDYYKSQVSVMVAANGKKLYDASPDKLMLAKLQKFCETQIWDSTDPWADYVERIRSRRNAIHAFQYKDIGSFTDWQRELREHLLFVRYINRLLFYPSGAYEPQEW